MGACLILMAIYVGITLRAYQIKSDEAKQWESRFDEKVRHTDKMRKKYLNEIDKWMELTDKIDKRLIKSKTPVPLKDTDLEDLHNAISLLGLMIDSLTADTPMAQKTKDGYYITTENACSVLERLHAFKSETHYLLSKTTLRGLVTVIEELLDFGYEKHEDALELAKARINILIKDKDESKTT